MSDRLLEVTPYRFLTASITCDHWRLIVIDRGIGGWYGVFVELVVSVPLPVPFTHSLRQHSLRV